MGRDGETIPKTLPGVERVLGRISGSGAGPTLVCVGGVHGNEMAGVLAIRRVLDRLDGLGGWIRGDVVAFSGNRGALSQGKRFLVRDLNRSWTKDSLDAVPGRESPASAEDREQHELTQALDRAVADARGPIFLLDLHTTSGPSAPFTATMDTPANREFAQHFPVPLILGFGRIVDGTFFGYLSARGITSLVFEGGQHEDPLSIRTSEAAIWIALASVGILPEPETPEVLAAKEVLTELGRDIPRVLEIRHRHAVASGDGFRMRPGFENFQPVSAGELLARDRSGDLRSPGDGRLLLPLYQAQGDDGFFLVMEPALARHSGMAGGSNLTGHNR